MFTVIARIGKTYSFDAAHQLPNHDGKCARPHGHTYSVTVEFEGLVKTEELGFKDHPDEGMVCDYAQIDAVMKPLVANRLDHRDLNTSIGNECWPTTAENIAGWLYRQLRAEPFIGHHLAAVEVCETPKTFARIDHKKQGPAFRWSSPTPGEAVQHPDREPFDLPPFDQIPGQTSITDPPRPPHAIGKGGGQVPE